MLPFAVCKSRFYIAPFISRQTHLSRTSPSSSLKSSLVCTTSIKFTTISHKLIAFLTFFNPSTSTCHPCSAKMATAPAVNPPRVILHADRRANQKQAANPQGQAPAPAQAQAQAQQATTLFASFDTIRQGRALPNRGRPTQAANLPGAISYQKQDGTIVNVTTGYKGNSSSSTPYSILFYSLLHPLLLPTPLASQLQHNNS